MTDDFITIPTAVIEEVRKDLMAAAILADGYGKPETASEFRRTRDLLGNALSSGGADHDR